MGAPEVMSESCGNSVAVSANRPAAVWFVESIIHEGRTARPRFVLTRGARRTAQTRESEA